MSLDKTKYCFEKDFFEMRLAEKKCERYLKKLSHYVFLQTNIYIHSRKIRINILPDLAMKTDLLAQFILRCQQFIINDYERVSKDGLSHMLQSTLGSDMALYVKDFYRPTSSDINNLYSCRDKRQLPEIPAYQFNFSKIWMLDERQN